MEASFHSDRSWGIFLAVAFHGMLFLAGSVGFLRHAEYGMDFSDGAAEVDLIAAPAPMASSAVEAPAQETPREIPPIQDKEDVAESAKTETLPAPPAATPVPNAILRTNDLTGPLGDGSSPVPGTDATTIHRAGSSGSFFRPGYYRNPPPHYPEEARKLKQEGRVLLEVGVTAEGKVSSVNLKQSSGFPLLDQAALDGVRNWRFKPASMAGMRIETIVQIPIRFQLK